MSRSENTTAMRDSKHGKKTSHKYEHIGVRSECSGMRCLIPFSYMQGRGIWGLCICMLAVVVYCIVRKKHSSGIHGASSSRGMDGDKVMLPIDVKSPAAIISTDPLTHANDYFKASYTQTKGSIAPDLILYNQGYSLVLARNGTVLRTQSFVPESMTTLKNIAHIPLSLYFHCMRVIARLEANRDVRPNATPSVDSRMGADSGTPETGTSRHVKENGSSHTHNVRQMDSRDTKDPIVSGEARDSIDVPSQTGADEVNHRARVLTSEERQFLLDFRDTLQKVDMESSEHKKLLSDIQIVRQLRILELSRTFLSQVLDADKQGAEDFFTAANLHTYTDSVKVMLQTNTFEAAGDLIRGLHSVLGSWVGLDTNSTCVSDPVCITQSEMRHDVHVLVYGNHMAKKGSLLAVYFTELLKLPNSNGDYECFGDRFVSDTNMKGLPKTPIDGVMNNFATHHADSGLGDAFGFNMHRDILEKGAIAATSELYWGGIVGP